jgi:EAL domain-containing protein (putative c-di-GMP-specific phosphodiesterase class I)
MQVRIDARASMEAALRKALSEAKLRLVYQVQLDAAGRLVGLEALSRWRNEAGDDVPPSLFTSVAEEVGLIHSVGAFALEQVCHQAIRWGNRLPDDARVAVNVSAPEFLDSEFPSRLLQIMNRTGVSGNRLCLELAEATIVTDFDFTADRMRLLRSHGIEFSLDDFGTGYSSLNYLRRLPISEVKIDRSYVSRMLEDPKDLAIVSGIIEIGTALGLRIVAEGVETEAQWEALRAYESVRCQGYLLGRPVAPSDDPRAMVAWPAR